MFTTTRNMHQSHSAVAAARVVVSPSAGTSTEWRFTAKPYFHPRPSGAPPG